MESVLVENSRHPSMEQDSVQIRGIHGYDQRRIRPRPDQSSTRRLSGQSSTGNDPKPSG